MIPDTLDQLTRTFNLHVHGVGEGVLFPLGNFPAKNKVVYASLANFELGAFDLKPEGYELVSLPYDLYCPLVQDKVKGAGISRYICKALRCKKNFSQPLTSIRNTQIFRAMVPLF